MAWLTGWSYRKQISLTGTEVYDYINESSGKSYTKDPQPSSSYPDDGDAELTDGLIDQATKGYDVGWQNVDPTIRIDLEESKSIAKVKIRYAVNTGDGVYAPNSVTIYGSENDSDWTELGTKSDFDSSGGNHWAEITGLSGSYRYVKFIFVRGGEWTMLSELEVYSKTLGDLSNYQIKLLVGESSGTESADFHIEGHSTNFPSAIGDGGDLRFTDDDGETLLDFWVEDVTGETPNRLATIWVKVTDNLASNQSIYCYYGKSGASNGSSGINTFISFWNFNDGQVPTNFGNYLGSAPIVDNAIKYEGDYSLKKGDARGIICGLGSIYTEGCIEFRCKVDPTQNYIFYWGDGTGTSWGNTQGSVTVTNLDDTWKKVKVFWYEDNRKVNCNGTEFSTTEGDSPGQVLCPYADSLNGIWWDLAFFRQYSPNGVEPAFSLAGDEEAAFGTKTGSFNLLSRLQKIITDSFSLKSFLKAPSSFSLKSSLVPLIQKFYHLINYSIDLASPSITKSIYKAPVFGLLDSYNIYLSNTGTSGQTTINIKVNNEIKETITISADDNECKIIEALDDSIIYYKNLIEIEISEVASDIGKLSLSVYQKTFEPIIRFLDYFNQSSNIIYKNPYLFIMSDYWLVYLNQPIDSLKSCFLRNSSDGKTLSLTSVLEKGNLGNNLVKLTPISESRIDFDELVIECLNLELKFKTIVIPIKLSSKYARYPDFIKESTSFQSYLLANQYQYSWNNSDWTNWINLDNGIITIDPTETLAGGSTTEGQRTLYIRYRLAYGEILSDSVTINYYYTTLNVAPSSNLQSIDWNDSTPLEKVDVYVDDEFVESIPLSVVIQGFSDDLVFSDLDTDSPKVTISSGKISVGNQVYSFDATTLTIEEFPNFIPSNPDSPIQVLGYYVIYFDFRDYRLKVKLVESRDDSTDLSTIATSVYLATSIPFWVFSLGGKLYKWESITGYYISETLNVIDLVSNKVDLTKYEGNLKLVYFDILGRTKTVEIPYLSGHLGYLYRLRVYTDSSKNTEIKPGEIHSNTSLYYYIEAI